MPATAKSGCDSRTRFERCGAAYMACEGQKRILYGMGWSMERIIAYCGLPCGDCPAYRATQAEDAEMLQQVLLQWREAFGAPHLMVADILCDGCQPCDGRLCGYCRHCRIRPCAMKRKLPNCGYCHEYACDELERLMTICDQQEGFFGYARRARSILEAVRRKGGVSREE